MQYVEINAGADWQVESLDVRLSGTCGAMPRIASRARRWRATIQIDEATVERVVPFGPETLVEFNSVWLVRSRLIDYNLRQGKRVM